MTIGDNANVRILLVEDDSRMRMLVRRGLGEAGHRVDVAETGPAALTIATSSSFDAWVVDVMLPGFDGVELVRRLRAAGQHVPALMLTARDAAADIVTALDAGADDYLIKPFAFTVLLARLRALGRRGTVPTSARFEAGDLSLDTATRVVVRGGHPIALTRTEFDLLEYLMRRSGRVVTRTALISAVWGDDRSIEGNTLDAFVKSLRQKIDAGREPRLLHTIRGVGYTVREDEDA